MIWCRDENWALKDKWLGVLLQSLMEGDLVGSSLLHVTMEYDISLLEAHLTG